MDLHYLTYMGRNLENRKKLTPVWIMNSANMNNNNIMNSVGIFKMTFLLLIESSRKNTGMNNVFWEHY